ncbi:MAG: class I SAM-dependent methyltransferase [Longimicrobiales bacterium]
MTHTEAVSFLAAAGPFHGTWTDVGAGSGTFSRALAELIGPGGAVIAIDRDERALARLEAQGTESDATFGPVTTIAGDMHELSTLAPLAENAVDGFLFANVLHYTRTPDAVLAQAAALLKPDGHIVVIEYERRMPNPWVPHSLPLTRLGEVATRAGLASPRDVAWRASAYHREMYCAVMERAR